MSVPQPLQVKFLRYFDAPSLPDNGSLFGIWLRILYEFWGFCVNGTDDLKHPGGFPTGSASDIHLTGVINMPTDWESGSTVLIYSNNNGITNNGMPFFTGSNFTSGMVGKWLTVWKSGSSSTDDSIYLITRLIGPPGTTTSSIIRVDTNMGCTPFSGNLKPSFTSRSNINYRVIDYAQINQTHTTFNYIVLQMNGAPYVNSGQANSQVRLRLASRAHTGDTVPRGVSILMCPSGTYYGTGSNDGSTGGNGVQISTLTDIGEVGPNSNSGADWHNNPGAGTQCINIIAAQDFFILYSRGIFASNGCGFHVEIPQRLYPFEYDPNPMAMCGFSYGLYLVNNNNAGYGAMYSFTSDIKPNLHFTSGHHQAGDSYNVHTLADRIDRYSNGYYNNMWYNVFTKKFLFTDGVIGTVAAIDQQYMARARLRRVRFIAPIIPDMNRLGDDGEWLHVNGGVLWPWDNAVLPATIFHQGL